MAVGGYFDKQSACESHTHAQITGRERPPVVHIYLLVALYVFFWDYKNICYWHE